MSDIKKITPNELISAIGDTYTNEKEMKWCGLDINVKGTLSLNEMMMLIDSVIGVCFDDTDSSYHPEKKDFAFRVAIVTLYTNLTLPENIEDAYDILYKTDLIQNIVGNYIDKEQLTIMHQAIDNKIKSIIDANIYKINHQIDELSHNFNRFQEEMSDYFDKFNPEELNKFVEMFDLGDLNEEKILQAVIKSNE